MIPFRTAAILAYLATLTLGAAILQAREPSPVLTKCTVPGTVALTFDDGPYIYLNEIVDTLKNAGAKATFFFNGQNWDSLDNPTARARVRYAFDNGFQVGSHTWSHKDLATLDYGGINSEMEEQALQSIIGLRPLFTRLPYGSYNDLVRQLADDRGQILANWDFDSRDSAGATAEQQKASYELLIVQHPESVLSLQHETLKPTARNVVPYIVPKLIRARYQLVTPAECLNRHAYA